MKGRSLPMLSMFCSVLSSCTAISDSRVSNLSSVVTIASQGQGAIAYPTSQGDSQIVFTREMAAKLCLNMHLKDAEAALGKPGKITHEYTAATDNAQSYEWKNPDGSYIWATFVEDKLIGTGAVGLSGSIIPSRDLSKAPIDQPLSEGCPTGN